jgi:tetratricopeptide (TPR) repeat protein
MDEERPEIDEETAAASETPAPARSILHWIITGAGMLVLALAAAVTVYFLAPRPPAPVQEDAALSEEEAAQATNGRAPVGTAFEFYQQGLILAQTDEEKIAAALEMADFLMQDGYWRSREERLPMAREYLLAALDMHPNHEQILYIAQQLFVLAGTLKEQRLIDAARSALDEAMEMENWPFDLLITYTDALYTLSDTTLYDMLGRLRDRASTRMEQLAYQMRMARGLYLALEKPEAMRALFARRNLAVPENARELLLERLEENALLMTESGHTEKEAEGLLHLAYIAGDRGQVDDEIELLRRAIARGASASRSSAYTRLTRTLREQGRQEEVAAALGRKIRHEELRAEAARELLEMLEITTAEEVVRELLLNVNYHVAVTQTLTQPDNHLLLAAAKAAIRQGWQDTAEQYLAQVEANSVDRRVLADVMLQRAELAQNRGDIDETIALMNEVISLFPGHPEEGNIRFMILEAMASRPHSEADLVGGVMGAIIREPQDPRGLTVLLAVAERLEAQHLYELAESYYRRAILFSSLQPSADRAVLTAKATMGQARMMWKTGRLADADALLRVINANTSWADIWQESGPLWAAIAFSQGQAREGIRRWRQTCGPPGGQLLPYVFDLLVPDLAEWSVRVDSGTYRRPVRVPYEMAELAVGAVVDDLLKHEEYDRLEALLQMAANDPEWGHRLPLKAYRTRWFEQLAERASAAELMQWVEQYDLEPTPPYLTEDALPLPAQVDAVMTTVERARSVNL